VFTASWADNCYFTHPLWVRFSNRFTTDKVKVLEVDCTGGAAFNKLVKAFKINTKGVANQLPTIVLLEDNKEYLRFPPIDVNTGAYGRVVNYKETELIKYFDLDKRYMSTVGN